MIAITAPPLPPLAAWKKPPPASLKKLTSSPKKRVWNFFNIPSGRSGKKASIDVATATGSVQYSYKTASGQEQHHEYDPFGNLVAQSGTLQQNYQWSSKEVDASTGLVYYLYRFYDPNLGRWVNRDPVEELGGTNIYTFVRNNAESYLDKYGLEKKEKVNCRRFAEKAEYGLYVGLGGKITAAAEGELCDCKCGNEIKKRDYIKVDLTIHGQVGIGAEWERKIFGAKFGGGIEGPQVPIYTTGFYEKECGEDKGSVHIEYHVSGVFGGELGVGEGFGLSASFNAEFSLYVGATLHQHGADIYAGASIDVDAEVSYNFGAVENTSIKHIYEDHNEFPLGHLSW